MLLAPSWVHESLESHHLSAVCRILALYILILGTNLDIVYEFLLPLIIHLVPHLHLLILSKNSYPDKPLHSKWALDCVQSR